MVEDDATVALVVSTTLQDAGCQVTHAANVRAATELLSHPFDVAVLDVGLPDGQGFEVLEALRRHASPCSAVMMTGDPNDTTVANSIAAGVSEFLAKPFDTGQLVAAVGRALDTTRRWRDRMELARGHDDGGDADRPSEPRAVVGAVDTRDLEPAVQRMVEEGGLTEREREILELILAGLQNSDIAHSLSISANTVKYHVRNILTKLGLESRTELFRSLLQR